MTYEPGWFDVLWNSTLGMPQQWLWRLARIARGDANVLSERGLMDAALIPGLALFDDHSDDVTSEELVGDNVWRRLAVELLTDPLMFMNAGPTTLARAARNFNRASSALKIADREAGEIGRMLVPDAMEHVRGLLRKADYLNPRRAIKAEQYLEEAARFYRQAGQPNISYAALLDRVRETVPMLTLPLGLASSRFRVVVSEAHRGWVGLLYSGTKHAVGRALAWQPVRSFPWAQQQLSYFREQAQAFRAGWRSGMAPRYGIAEQTARSRAELWRRRGVDPKLAEERMKNLHPGLVAIQEQTLDRMGYLAKAHTGIDDPAAAWREYTRGISSRSLKKRARRAAPSRLALRAILDIKYRDIQDYRIQNNISSFWKAERELVEQNWDTYRSQLGLRKRDLDSISLNTMYDELRAQHEFDRSVMDAGFVFPARGSKFDERDFEKGLRAFRIAESAAALARRTVIGPTGWKQMDDLARAQEEQGRAFQRATDQMLRLFSLSVREVARYTGQPYEDVERALGVMLEIIPTPDDVEPLVRALEGPDMALRGRAINRVLRNYMDRLMAISVMAKDAKGPLWEGIQRGLATIGVTPSHTGMSLSAPFATLVGHDVGAGVPKIAPHAVRARAALHQLEAWWHAQRKSLGPIPMAEPMPYQPELIQDLVESLAGIHNTMLAEFFRFSGQAGKDYMQAALKLKETVFRDAKRLSILGTPVPLAHWSRVITAGEAERVQKILGGVSDPNVAKVINEARAAHLRNWDYLPVIAVNDFLDQIRNEVLARGGKRGELLRTANEVARIFPETRDYFSPVPHVGILVEYGQLKRYDGLANFVNDLTTLTETGTTGQEMPTLWGGVVENVGHGPPHRFATTQSGRPWPLNWPSGSSTATTIAPREIIRKYPAGWLMVRSQNTGQRVFVPLDASIADISVAVAGRGDSVGAAVAAKLAHDPNLQTISATATVEDLKALIGQHVLVAPTNVLRALPTALGRTASGQYAVVRSVYDTVHSMLKSAATIPNPSFHVFNMLGSFFMGLHDGLSVSQMMGGTLDAIRILNLDPKFDTALGRIARLSHYGRAGWIGAAATGAALGGALGLIQEGDLEGLGTGAALGAASGLGVRALPGAVGRVARGAPRLSEISRIAAGAPELLQGKTIFEPVGNRWIDLLGFFRETGSEGLWNTFGSRAFEVGRETEQMARIRRPVGTWWKEMRKLTDASTRPRAIEALRTKLRDLMSSVGEYSEILPRLALTMAYTRAGLSVSQAARAAVRVLVNYSDITPFERDILRRTFSFYVFPRKWLPVAAEEIGRAPGRFVPLVHSMYGMDKTDVDRGDLTARFGDYSTNVSRLIPQLETIGAASWIADYFLPWGGFEPQRTGEAPVRWAIPAEIILGVKPERLGPQGRAMGAMLQDVLRVSYITRSVLVDENNPLKPEQTAFERFMLDWVFGVRKPGRFARARWLIGQYRFLAGEIADQLRSETDPETRQALVEQHAKITRLTSRLIQESL